MTVQPIAALTPAIEFQTVAPEGTGAKFAATLGALLDRVNGQLASADASAAAVALGRGSIADAAVARAKADVLLEIAAVAASRLSGAISSLLQTQV